MCRKSILSSIKKILFFQDISLFSHLYQTVRYRLLPEISQQSPSAQFAPSPNYVVTTAKEAV